MTTYEKLVDGATKIKLAVPKPKYVEPILMATSDGERSDQFRTIMRALSRRLQDTAWTIVFKSLVVLHIMIREGEANVTLTYLANHLSMLDLRIGKGGKFISNGGELNQLYMYNNYLAVRAKEFHNTSHDFITATKKPFGTWDSNDKSSILRDLSVEKGLLRETESVQKQIDALLKCKFRENEVNNDLVILSFRMLTTDLISLYQSLNEGVLNILEHFFDLSKPDAERAFEIYEHFTKETKKVIEFLRTAKHLEKVTNLKVPTIKHAQTSLTMSLKEYLDDSDFEINRRQYLAEKEFKKEGSDKNSRLEDSQKSQKQGQKTVTQDTSQQPVLGAYQPIQQTGSLQLNQQQQQQQQQQEQLFQQQVLQQQLFEQQALQQQQQILEQQALHQSLQQQATYGVQQQTTGFNPFANMNSFTVQPTINEIPPPQGMNASSLPQNAVNRNSYITTPYSQPRVLSNNFTGNGFGGYGNDSGNFPQATNVNSLNRSNTVSSNNPFTNSRFSSTSNTTAFTSQESNISSPSSNQGPIKPVSTGTNPFRLETNPTNMTSTTIQQPIRPQATAGGLEKLRRD